MLYIYIHSLIDTVLLLQVLYVLLCDLYYVEINDAHLHFALSSESHGRAAVTPA